MADTPFFDDSNPPAAYLNIGSISIFFASKHCSGLPSDTIPDGYLSTSTIGGAQSPINETLRDTCLAYYTPGSSSGNDPTNQNTLDNLTEAFQQDYTNWRRIIFDYSFLGILNFAQSGLVDAYEFVYSSVKEVCNTRIYTYPFDYVFHELGHFDYDNDCQDLVDTGQPNFDGAPQIYYYAPPVKCVNGVLQLTRYGLILEDGRIVSQYVSTDPVSP